MSATTLSLALVFVLAVVHKTTIVASGDPSEQPLLQNRGLSGARATAALVVAATAEAAIAGLLVFAPVVGCFASAALLAVYAREIGRLPDGRSCQCLGSALDTRTARGAIVRNVGMAAAATVAGIAGALGVVEVGEVGQASIGVALLAVASGAAIVTMQRRVERQRAVMQRKMMMSKTTGGHVAD